MYHDVICNSPSESGFQRDRDLPYKVSKLAFEQQVKSIKEYLRINNLPFDSIQFTFDDGGHSCYDTIAPILEDNGFIGCFFVSTKFIDSPSFLSKSEIAELSKRGHLIGSHAHSHEHLYMLDDSQLLFEWEESTRILSNIIGEPITSASIPNGDLSKRVLNSMIQCGISTIFTSEPTTKELDYYSTRVIGRFVVQGADSVSTVLSIISSKRTRFIKHFKRMLICFIKSLLGEKYIYLKYKLYH